MDRSKELQAFIRAAGFGATFGETIQYARECAQKAKVAEASKSTSTAKKWRRRREAAHAAIATRARLSA